MYISAINRFAEIAVPKLLGNAQILRNLYRFWPQVNTLMFPPDNIQLYKYILRKACVLILCTFCNQLGMKCLLNYGKWFVDVLKHILLVCNQIG